MQTPIEKPSAAAMDLAREAMADIDHHYHYEVREHRLARHFQRVLSTQARAPLLGRD